jgi:hypothetical protein
LVALRRRIICDRSRRPRRPPSRLRASRSAVWLAAAMRAIPLES